MAVCCSDDPVLTCEKREEESYVLCHNVFIKPWEFWSGPVERRETERVGEGERLRLLKCSQRVFEMTEKKKHIGQLQLFHFSSFKLYGIFCTVRAIGVHSLGDIIK